MQRPCFQIVDFLYSTERDKLNHETLTSSATAKNAKNSLATHHYSCQGELLLQTVTWISPTTSRLETMGAQQRMSLWTEHN